jgi:hypothetical protein
MLFGLLVNALLYTAGSMLFIPASILFHPHFTVDEGLYTAGVWAFVSGSALFVMAALQGLLTLLYPMLTNRLPRGNQSNNGSLQFISEDATFKKQLPTSRGSVARGKGEQADEDSDDDSKQQKPEHDLEEEDVDCRRALLPKGTIENYATIKEVSHSVHNKVASASDKENEWTAYTKQESKRSKKFFCISAEGMLQLAAIASNSLSLLGATLFLIGSAAFLPQFGSIGAEVGNWTYRFGSSSYATSSIIGIIALLYRSSTRTSSGDIVTMMTIDKWLNMAVMFNYMGGALLFIIGGVFFLKDLAAPASVVWAVGSGFFLSGSLFYICLAVWLK